MNVSTPSVLRFLSVMRHESPRYNYAFIEKAQHLRRWIPLRTLTRGRLVPRQPRAIKRTTRTELHGDNIHHGRYIHWNIGTTPTALHRYNIHYGGCIHWNIDIIPTALRGEHICNEGKFHWEFTIKPTALHNRNIRNNGHIHWNIGTTSTALLNW